MSTLPGRPPLLGRALLRLRRLGPRRREVEDDLLELFEQRARDRGRRHASWRYCVDVLHSHTTRGLAWLARRRRRCQVRPPDVQPAAGKRDHHRRRPRAGHRARHGDLQPALLSLTALSLAAIGLFGVTAFAVNQRRHEVSVRMALGATGSAIVRMLLRDSLRPVVVGMACGLGLALLAGQVISRVLYGISGHDPAAILGAVLVLSAAAVAAVLFPATRAARTNPAEMLKQS